MKRLTKKPEKQLEPSPEMNQAVRNMFSLPPARVKEIMTKKPTKKKK